MWFNFQNFKILFLPCGLYRGPFFPVSHTLPPWISNSLPCVILRWERIDKEKEYIKEQSILISTALPFSGKEVSFFFHCFLFVKGVTTGLRSKGKNDTQSKQVRTQVCSGSWGISIPLIAPRATEMCLARIPFHRDSSLCFLGWWSASQTNQSEPTQRLRLCWKLSFFAFYTHKNV